VIYGYARVSTDGQSLDAQRAELVAAGCAKVFGETASGARADRPRLARALAALDPGDVLVVTRLDRLARSTRDLLNVLASIAAKGAAFRSLRACLKLSWLQQAFEAHAGHEQRGEDGHVP
jgi:DNA invertase Pin-like site-specific DNA recombinase